MTLDAGVSALIGDLYGGIVDTRRWDGAVNGLVARTGAHFALLLSLDLVGRKPLVIGVSGENGRSRFADGAAEYDSHMWRNDPNTAYAVRRPQAGWFDSRHQVADDSPYLDWQRDRLGSNHWVTAFDPTADGLAFGIALHAPVARGALGDDDIALFRLIFPHVRRAVDLAGRTPDLADATDARLLVDDRGRVVAASPAAVALCMTGDGVRLVNHRLCGCRGVDNRRIDALIASAATALVTGGVAPAIRIERPSGRRALIVRASPLPRVSGLFAGFDPAALVQIVDPAADAPPQAVDWASLFGLTPAEVRLVTLLLTDDGTLRAAAETLGIAYATARVHLANVFDKVGVRSQSSLIRLFSRLQGP